MAQTKKTSGKASPAKKPRKAAAETENPPVEPLDKDSLARNAAAMAPMVPELVEISRLCMSGLNVRRTERDADIASLAEDIAANGLKQNLVVIPAHFMTAEIENIGTKRGAFDGKMEVIAGARRFQALQLLVKDGRLPADTPIPCLVETREAARSTSLSENLQRVAMNPADEFEAYAAITAELENQGATPEDAQRQCARRFGKTVSHVEGRLRLAALAPDILQALREDRLTFEAAKAYATVSDTDLQLKVFQQEAKSNWQPHNPASIRDKLRGKTLPVTDARVRFVGLETYLAEGGRTEVEMFMGAQGEERIMDIRLLEKLAAEKAEPLVDAQAKKDGFLSGLYASGVMHQHTRPKAPSGFSTPGWDNHSPTKAQLKKSIGIYAIDAAGSGLTKVGRYMPNSEKSKHPVHTPPTEEELAAARRERDISNIAARLAVGPFAGSPFEGRAYWPRYNVVPVDHISDDEVMVAVLVKVTAADIAAQRSAAEEQYEAALAEQQAEQETAKQAAEQPAAPDASEPEVQAEGGKRHGG